MNKSAKEYNRVLNEWCRSIGIKKVDLGCETLYNESGRAIPYTNAHPRMNDDLPPLLAARQEYWQFWDRGEKWQWQKFFYVVYENKCKLTKSSENRLIKLIQSGDYKQKQRQEQSKKARALRQHKQQLLEQSKAI
jgi:hypothetical protein